jgi:hypothetical protein
LKEIPPASYVFQGGDRISLVQIGLLSRIEETHVSLQGKPSMLDAAVLAHCFPVRIEFIFESSAFCKSEFSMWRKAHFLRNMCIH